MERKSVRWVGLFLLWIAPFAGIRAEVVGSVPKGELQWTCPSAVEGPVSIQTFGREWLQGKVEISVVNEAKHPKSTGSLRAATFETIEQGIAWKMDFDGPETRSGHTVTFSFPILDADARIFTPSQYGVMEVRTYPEYTPVPYAFLGWESGQAYVLPLVSVLDEATDTGLTFALPPDENIPNLQVAWTNARELTLSLGHRGMGGGTPSPLTLLCFGHKADYRDALRVYSDLYPRYFKPGIARGPYEGTFYYHHIQAHPDFEEMARQRVRHVWTSFWFTHLGEYLPDAAEWEPYTYAKWWKLGETMSDARIRDFAREMHDHGIGVFAYFNVTEYGGAGGKSGDTAEAARILKERFADALIRNEKNDTVPTWEGAMAMNCGKKYALWPFLEEQLQRHLKRLPEIDGFDIDRLDWCSVMDYAHDDGLTMFGERRAENLAVPVGEAIRSICATAHAADKRVFVNQFYRIEPLCDVDGYVHENDYLPAMAYLAPYRPAAAWNMRKPYTGDLLQFETQLKRRLQWALFPQMIAREFPISQQGANPNAAAMLEIYAPLFDTLLGKEQMLLPHCVAVTGANDVNLFRNGLGYYVAPLTSRIRFMCRDNRATEAAMVRLRTPDADGLAWAHIYPADSPPYAATVSHEVSGEATIQVERHGTASIVVAGSGAAPALQEADAAYLAATRQALFPGPAAAVLSPAIVDFPKGFKQARIALRGVHLGQAGPVVLSLAGAPLGTMASGMESFVSEPVPLPLSGSTEVTLDAGAEGVWYWPESVAMLAESDTGERMQIAQWTPDLPAVTGPRSTTTLRLQWMTPQAMPVTKARFEGNSKTFVPVRARAAAIWTPDAAPASDNGFRLEVTTGESFVWQKDVQDDRLPLAASGNPSNTASCWFGPENVSLTIHPPDGDDYLVSVHVLDFDYNGRAENIILHDAYSTLDTQSVSARQAASGMYLTWRVRGPLQLDIRKTAGHNAVVSAVYLSKP